MKFLISRMSPELSRFFGILTVFTVLFLTAAFPASGQNARPRIGVLEIRNSTGQSTYDSLADTIRQTVVLTLNLLDRYEVIDENVPVGENPAGRAAALPADSLLWGEVQLNEQDRIVISLTIFDRLEDRIVLSQEGTAQSLLGIFDTADELVGQVIGAFSGIRVGFGTIRLNVSGQGDYRVFLDGIHVGENVSILDRILSGDYRLRVEQSLPTGFHAVVDQVLTLEENAQVSVAVQLLDADSIRLQELATLAAGMDRLMAAPVGPGPILGELQSTLARYEAMDPDAMDLEWYQTRIALEREYREILDYQYFESSRPSFDRDLPRQVLAATYQLRDDLPGSTFGSTGREQLVEASRRNLNTFYGVMMLAADYQTILGNVASQALPYEILFDMEQEGLTIFGPLQGTHTPTHERTLSQSMAREHQSAVEQQRPLWHNVLFGAGALGVTTAGLIFGTGIPWDRLDEGDETYARYEATTDPDEAVRLREETQDSYDEANMLFLVGGTAGVLGVAALTTGIIARVRSVRRPQRIMDGYLQEIGNQRLEGALSFFEEGDETRLVLVRGTGPEAVGQSRNLRFGDQPASLENGPAVYRDLAPGRDVTWTSTRDSYSREHVIHAGRNVLYVP